VWKEVRNMPNGNAHISEVLNPRGVMKQKTAAPINERQPDLKGKTVYLIDVGKQDADILFDALEQYLSERESDTRFVRTKKTTTYFEDDPEIWSEVKSKADSFILGAFD
jgi:hypothetical protein